MTVEHLLLDRVVTLSSSVTPFEILNDDTFFRDESQVELYLETL